MSEFLNQQAMKVVSKSSENEDRQIAPDTMKSLEKRGSVLVPASQMEKINEFFHICDSEDKGYITPSDMRVKNRKLFVIFVWENMNDFPYLIFPCCLFTFHLR